MPTQQRQQRQANGARWHEYPSLASKAEQRRNLWGSGGEYVPGGYVSPDEDETSSSEEDQEVRRSRHPQQDIRPTSSVTTWVIPSTVEELAPPPKTDVLAVTTPDKASTPSRSNLRKKQNTSVIQRSLHNSHRKKRLHNITPKANTYNDCRNTITGVDHQTGQQQHRGNGVVMDLTSLFIGDGDSKVPITPETTASTAASTPHNHLFGKTTSNAYLSPSPPPWKTHPYRDNNKTTVASPFNVPGLAVREEEQEHHHIRDTNTIHTRVTTTDKTAFQWDTKSQTTQEALLTERQCEALTQWLNFHLVGESSRMEELSPSLAITHKQPNTSAASRFTLKPSGTGDSMDSDTITTRHAGTPTSGRPGTPVTTATSAKRRRRFSVFQYSQSYDCVNEQAQHWFQKSALWKDLRLRIRCEIASGKLTLREDRDLYANVAVREKLLDLLLSYRPVWLTLGLEVVMNETLPTPHGHTLPTQKEIKRFIVSRILSDSKLLSKYTQGGGSRVPSGQFAEMYHKELRPLVLYRILVLVFFLDRAAGRYQGNLGNLFANSPDANTLKSKGNSSAQVLVTICREFLSRQGDIIKQLARVNLHVYHRQDRLDEIEFQIHNFAIDLRDGVRVSRLVELLWLLPQNSPEINETTKYPILSQLRIPAISRLQKLHNVNVVLTALQQDCQIGLPQDLQAHHIVDGQRRMVMRLVWTLVLMHCFENQTLLTKQQLEDEVARLNHISKRYQEIQEKKRQKEQQRDTLQLLEQETDGLDSVTIAMSVDGSSKATKKHTASKRQRKPNRLPPTLAISHSRSLSFDGDDALSCQSVTLLDEFDSVQQWKVLLMQWCERVCTLVADQGRDKGEKAPKGDWTSSDLSNGKALCCLIHYYHPNLLSREELRLENSTNDNGPPTCIQTIHIQPGQRRSKFRHTFQQRLKPKIGPDYHIRLAHKRLDEIGGIPAMMLVPFSTPVKHQQRRRKVAPLAEEKSVLVYLYHISARLLESHHEVQAVIYVQQRFRYLSWVSWQKRKRTAAVVLWKHWQEKKDNYFRARSDKYKRAVEIIESFTICHFDKLLLLQATRLERGLQSLAAIPIQALMRRFLAKERYHVMLDQHYAAIMVQSQYRQFHCYILYQGMLSETVPAICTIQRHWRGYVQRRSYTAVVDAIIRIQAFARGAVLVRKSLLGSWRDSSTCIQRIWRGFWVQLHYQMNLLDIVAVQCLVRKQQAINLANRKSRAVEILQYNVRGHLAKRCLARLRQERYATIFIQKNTRRYFAILEAEKRRAKLALDNATLVVQRSWRRTLFVRERVAASTKIQMQYRLMVARRAYFVKRAAAIRAQTQLRLYAARREYLQHRRNIILTQSAVRRWFYGLVCVQRRYAALQMLQNCSRRWLSVCALESMRVHWAQVIQKAIICQSFVRRRVCLQEWLHTRRAVLRIQAYWRLHRWVKCTRRKWQLISALATCPLLLRRSRKGAFKIIPHSRRVVDLNKQALARCGRKEIALSNAETWAVPFRAHRQNVFLHRCHVKTVRQKFRSGVRLEDLVGRRKIGLKALQRINQGASNLQEPWQYHYFNPIEREMKLFSKKLAAQRYQDRRVSRAKKMLCAGCKSLVEQSKKPTDKSVTKDSFEGAIHRMISTAVLPSNQKVARLLSLARREVNLPSRVIRGDSDLTAFINALASDPWMIKELKIASTVTIQCYWRGYAATSQKKKMLGGILALQSSQRGHLIRKRMQGEASAAISIQGIARCRLARLELSNLMLKYKAATALQSIIRGYLARESLHLLQTRATTMQRYARGLIARDSALRRRAVVITTQRYVRGFLSRQQLSFENFAVTEIQKTWRAYEAKEGFKVIVVATIKIQSSARMANAKRKKTLLWTEHCLRQESATRIQAPWRMAIARRRMSTLEMRSIAAVRVQSMLRRVFAAAKLEELREGRRQLSFALKRLEQITRASSARENKAVLVLQCASRVYLANQLLDQKQSLQQRQTTVNIEEAAFEAPKSVCVLHRRLSLSQGLVRGFLTRKHSNAEVRKSISLIKEAELRSRRDPSLRLGARMERALKLLQASTNLTEIMNIVCTLEMATRFSKECCDEFVLGKATEILVKLMPTCNKSLPHVELLYYIMCTLSNVSKHASLVEFVATLDAADAFVYLIRMYGSEDAIFCSAVSLLELCALQNPAVPGYIASQKRLEGIYKTWERKLHHKKVVKPSPFRMVLRPQCIAKRSKAKTDMLILGISYDLDQGVSTLARILDH